MAATVATYLSALVFCEGVVDVQVDWQNLGRAANAIPTFLDQVNPGTIAPNASVHDAVFGSCAPGWANFASATELSADPNWIYYFRYVYGTLPPHEMLPFCTADLWIIYDKYLATYQTLPATVGQCPTKGAPEGQRYNLNNRYSPAFTSWSWHAPPYLAFGESIWIEIVHQQDPFGDENYGSWLLYAKGSGVWFNTGKTISFNEHADSYAHFKVGGDNEAMSRAAAAAGFDSVQFVAHVDHVNYVCDTVVGAPYMNLEIVAVKIAGKYSCGTANAADTPFRAGWAASKACVCDNSIGFANCQFMHMSDHLV